MDRNDFLDCYHPDDLEIDQEDYRNNPCHCPICGSSEWSIISTDYEYAVVICMVECKTCHFKANETYVLSKIHPIGE